jgi:predicted heme/steroid binding protein
MKDKVKPVFIFLVILNVLVLGFVTFFWIKSDLQVKAKSKTVQSKIKLFTVQELSRYDGVNPKLPIYLALDGYVYDVSKGREFYKVGGPYHDLAGRDASKELHLVGGGIIKRKYPIIGKL